jgi:cellobiose phosphorylase
MGSSATPVNNGYFDDARREYVATRPDTPRAWRNYLGSTEYGVNITNNADGYSFQLAARNQRSLGRCWDRLQVSEDAAVRSRDYPDR